MSDYNSKTYGLNTITYDYIEELCNLILVKEGEQLDFEQYKVFINNFFKTEAFPNGEKQDIRNFAQQRVTAYIESIPSGNPLFVFASDNGYLRYRKDFRNYFDECNLNLTRKGKPKIRFPEQFDYLFDYIQEAIDLHTLYEKFSTKMTGDVVAQAKKEAETASKNAADAAVTAQREAKAAAKKASSKAIKMVLDENRIESEIESKVDTHMGKVTSKVTETSVTILGIFSGIVLTVVSGFFYSSSVLENIAKANISKLVCISSLVGFVCIQLIAILFFFITGISTIKSKEVNKDKEPNKNKKEIKDSKNYSYAKSLHITVSILLIIIMFFFAFIPIPLDEKERDKEDKRKDFHNQTTVTQVTTESTTSS